MLRGLPGKGTEKSKGIEVGNPKYEQELPSVVLVAKEMWRDVVQDTAGKAGSGFLVKAQPKMYTEFWRPWVSIEGIKTEKWHNCRWKTNLVMMWRMHRRRERRCLANSMYLILNR